VESTVAARGLFSARSGFAMTTEGPVLQSS
jgi:hypothetical protein